jgi:acetyltransferase-like isoleucine patch superfamily enzyme
MKEVSYTLAKIRSKFSKRKKEAINDYFRRQGIKIGRGCNICSNIVTPESFLIEIGNNVTVGHHVDFVTHDNSISKIDSSCPNLYGKIKIGNNCFIGERAALMYGVELCDNVIVASGSVVTNSFARERIIIGGNPAKIIGNWDDFLAKNKDNAASRVNIEKTLEKNPQKLIKRKIKE